MIAIRSEKEISMDYNRSISMTHELEEIAERFRRITQEEAINELNTLASNWRGENSDHFMRMVSTYLRSTSDVATELERIASRLRANAQAVYNAEMNAIRIASERNY